MTEKYQLPTTVLGAIQDDPEFSIFYSIIKKAGMEDYLKRSYVTILPVPNSTIENTTCGIKPCYYFYDLDVLEARRIVKNHILKALIVPCEEDRYECVKTLSDNNLQIVKRPMAFGPSEVMGRVIYADGSIYIVDKLMI